MLEKARLSRWLGEWRHLGEEEIVACLDGELGPRQSRTISRHLASCWRCRGERDALERLVADYTALVRNLDETAPPPSGWSGFERRLQRAVAEEEPRRGALPRWLQQVSLPRLAGCVAALVLLVWAAHRFSAVPTVSAKEALARACAAERDNAIPLLHQRVRVSRTRRGRDTQSAIVHAWYDRTAARGEYRGGSDVWQDLERILRESPMAGGPLLSAASYSSWHDSLAAPDDRIQREDGNLFRVTTNSRRSTGILEVGLLLRGSDWHVVEENLIASSGGEVWEYRLVELAFDASPRETVRVRTSTPDGSRPVTRPEVLDRAVEPAPVSVPLDDLEMQARYAIHRLGLCRNGTVEVVRSGDRIEIRGLLEDEAARESLRQAAPADLSWKVRTLDEVPETIASRTSTRPAIDLRSGTAPIENWLKVRHYGPEARAELMTQVVATSAEAMGEAWELRHMAEAYPADRVAQLTPAGRTTLERMMSDHAATLQSCRAKLGGLLQPILPAASDAAPAEPPGDWPDMVRTAFETTREMDSLTHSLFAGTNPPVESPEPALEQIGRQLVRLRIAETLRTGIGRALAAETAPGRR